MASCIVYREQGARVPSAGMLQQCSLHLLRLFVCEMTCVLKCCFLTCNFLFDCVCISPLFLFQLPGTSTTRYPRTVQPFFQVLRRHKFWWSSEALPQRPPPAAYSQCPGKGEEENKDCPLRVGGINIRAKERHRYGDRR